jgi:branched-chain amino acid transport system ATP-binding protein
MIIDQNTIKNQMEGKNKIFEPLLSVKNVSVSYGVIKALKGISFDVFPGQVVAIIGANGAGKTTTLNAISGLVKIQSGEIIYKKERISGLQPDLIVRKGVVHVPEGRRIFPNLTVHENLRLAAYIYSREEYTTFQGKLEEVFSKFPRLKERQNQLGGTLSGGEQQMLAIARALITGGDIMLMDEPSMGLAPVLVKEIFSIIRDINRSGKTMLLVEQNARMALRLANYCYVLETGIISFSGTPEEIMGNKKVVEAYLGGS